MHGRSILLITACFYLFKCYFVELSWRLQTANSQPFIFSFISFCLFWIDKAVRSVGRVILLTEADFNFQFYFGVSFYEFPELQTVRETDEWMRMSATKWAMSGREKNLIEFRRVMIMDL